MSKRFGRNQRRKMREEIAELNGLLGSEMRLHDKIVNDLRRERDRRESEMSEWARRIARAMPKNSPFLREIDTMILSRGADPRHLRDWHRQPVRLADLMLSPDVFPETVSEAIIDLFSITCDVYDDTIAMRRMVRIEVPTGNPREQDNVLAYAVDLRTLLDMRGNPDFVREYLGEKLIRDFTRAWGDLAKKPA